MKQQSYKLTIDKPCGQNWTSMTQNDIGKYCSQCSKTVVDFTKLTDDEIIRIVQQTSGKLCGRLANTQLNRFLEYNQRSTPSRVYKIFAGLILAGTTERLYPTSKPIYKAEVISIANNEKLLEQEAETNNNAVEDSLKNVIEGKIVDAHTKEPIPFANLLIKETEIKATSDADGKFKLIIPKSLMSETVTLVAIYVGYEKIEFTINRKDLPIKKELLMMPGEQITLGEVGVIRRKRWWQFWK